MTESRRLCFDDSSTVRWRTTEGRKGRKASSLFVCFCLGWFRLPQEPRHSIANSGKETGRTENTTSCMVCSLTPSNKPEDGLPDDVRAIGGWGLGLGARAGWEVKKKKGGYYRVPSTVARWRVAER